MEYKDEITSNINYLFNKVNNDDMNKLVRIAPNDNAGKYGEKKTRYYNVKKDLSVLSEISQNYYNDFNQIKPSDDTSNKDKTEMDESGRCHLSTSEYCKELMPAIIEDFNQQLEKANLNRLTTIEENALRKYSNYPSVLGFVLHGAIPLIKLAKFHEKDDADTAARIKSQLTRASKLRNMPKNFINYFIKDYPKIVYGEQTVWMRTFSSLAQNDRIMGRMPISMYEELQKIIVSDVIEPAFDRIMERSDDI